jgi:hypothetical protein
MTRAIFAVVAAAMSLAVDTPQAVGVDPGAR